MIDQTIAKLKHKYNNELISQAVQEGYSPYKASLQYVGLLNQINYDRPTEEVLEAVKGCYHTVQRLIQEKSITGE